jgi:hypothetical protein
MGLTIRAAIDEGAAEFDMLWGVEPYKFLWARDRRELRNIQSFPRASAAAFIVIFLRPVAGLLDSSVVMSPNVRRLRSHVKTAVASAIAKAHDHGSCRAARCIPAARHRLPPHRRGLRGAKGGDAEHAHQRRDVRAASRLPRAIVPLRLARRDRRSTAERAALPRTVAAITFDDGYQDVYELALPILERKGFRRRCLS